MTGAINIWALLAGVALFLLGIRFMEESLQRLSGRRFKLFLKKQTSNKIKAIGGGAIVTGVLQSSSLVSLMVLAFVGAGIISMQNALAVILGANLGTTLDSWIVALIGFKLNIENIALPVAGIAGIGFALFNQQTKYSNLCRFLFGFSLLFVGLGYMKTGMLGFVNGIAIRQFAEFPLIVTFGMGFIITSLIQSSSATIAITLSALYSGVVTLPAAMAIVLGSEVGTTIKLFVASLKGGAAKKRVALGNFIFNLINAGLILIFLVPLQQLITYTIGIRDNLIALVLFQTLVNVIGILLFYPFLNIFGRYLEKRFTSNDEETIYIHKVSPAQLTEALIAMEKENLHLLYAVMDFSWSCLPGENKYSKEMNLHKGFADKALMDKYAYIKFLHGELHSYYIQMQKSVLEKDDIEKLDRTISSVRNCMYAAKSIKDAIPDMEQLQNSSNDIKYHFYCQVRDEIDRFLHQLYKLLSGSPDSSVENLVKLYKKVTMSYTDTLKQLYRESIAGSVNEAEITTMLNCNREIFTGFKSFVFAVKDFLFSKEESHYFDELPGFIR